MAKDLHPLKIPLIFYRKKTRATPDADMAVARERQKELER